MILCNDVKSVQSIFHLVIGEKEGESYNFSKKVMIAKFAGKSITLPQSSYAIS